MISFISYPLHIKDRMKCFMSNYFVLAEGASFRSSLVWSDFIRTFFYFVLCGGPSDSRDLIQELLKKFIDRVKTNV